MDQNGRLPSRKGAGKSRASKALSALTGNVCAFELASGALINLNHPPRYVHWHFFQMSVSNLIVIVAMIVVFWLAVLLPFPRRGSKQ